MTKITWPQALAWRMRRQLLDPLGRLSVPGVVSRLGGVQAQVASSADLAIRLRRLTPRRGEVQRALSEGRLIKTWAMRGALHLLTAEEAGTFLSLLAAGRSWELPSWERYFGMTRKHWDLLRPAVREALDGTMLTREELVAAITARRGLAHVGDGLRSGWGTLLKPLAWQGDLCFGPSRGSRVTFIRPEAASSRWAGIPDADDAAPAAIRTYVGAYGPATMDGFSNWISRGKIPRKRLRAWFGALGGHLVEVEVDGERAYVLAEHLDEVASARPTAAVRLLGGFDPYVLGPGTEDARVVPAARRWAVSRQSGWIAPIVVARGVVSGTWDLDGDRAQIAWFREAGRPPRKALEEQAARLSSVLDRGVRAVIGLT